MVSISPLMLCCGVVGDVADVSGPKSVLSFCTYLMYTHFDPKNGGSMYL
jgi:hypothetical protein